MKIKFSYALNIFLGVALVLVLLEGHIAPEVAIARWGDNYKESMFNCDHAMREHYIAKRAVSVAPSLENIKLLQSAEVGLLACHDYDKLRKQMIVWKVTPEQLSLLGIEAIEEQSYELQRFIEIHEIRY